MTRIALLALFFIYVGCETAPHSGQAEYEQKIDSYSAGDKQFSGLYQNFEFRATIFNDEIIRLVNSRLARIYEWDDSKSSVELQSRLNHAQTNTRLFLSFFTPQIIDDNLTESKSIWKVYLVSGGTRYEGKVSKANEHLSEATVIFPYHTRFATGYFVDFPVATSAVQSSQLKFIVTGPLGKREADFPPNSSL